MSDGVGDTMSKIREKIRITTPSLNGLNSTEYWWLREIMESRPGDCKWKTSGFAEYTSIKVKVPSGDCYHVEEFLEQITGVTKIDTIEDE